MRKLATIAALVLLGAFTAQAAEMLLLNCDTVSEAGKTWSGSSGATVALAPSHQEGSGALRMTVDDYTSGGSIPSIYITIPGARRGAAWSSYEGLKFWVRGNGESGWGEIALQDASWYRWFATFPITNAVWHEVTIPWREFASRHFNDTMENNLTNVEGMVFTYTSAIGPGHPNMDPVDGKVFDVDNIRLVNGLTLPTTPVPTGTSIDNVRTKLEAQQSVKIVVMGTSIAWGTKLNQESGISYPTGNETYAFPNQLQGLLRTQYGYSGVTVVNQGIGGNSTHQCMSHLGKYVWEEEPADLVIIGAFYANDWEFVNSGQHAQITDNYERILGHILRRGTIDVMVANTGLQIASGDVNFYDNMVTTLEAECAEMNVLVADCYWPVQALGDTWLLAAANKYYIHDNVHIGSAGQLKFAEIIRDTIVDSGVTSNPPTINSVSPAPNPAFVGSSVTFSSSIGGTGPFAYNWVFGDGDSDTAGSPSHSYSTDGTKNCSLTVTNAYGSDTTNFTVQVDPVVVTQDSLIQDFEIWGAGGVSSFGNHSDTNDWELSDGSVRNWEPTHSGTWAAYLEDPDIAAGAWLRTPLLTGGAQTLTFWARIYRTGGTVDFNIEKSPNGSDWTLVEGDTQSFGTWEEHVIDVGESAPTYLRFIVTGAGVLGTEWLMIDDIVIAQSVEDLELTGMSGSFGTTAGLNWSAASGTVYEIFHTADLVNTNWLSAGTVTASQGSASFDDATISGIPSRYYQIRHQP